MTSKVIVVFGAIGDAFKAGDMSMQGAAMLYGVMLFRALEAGCAYG